jgi:hypothetical protein
MEKLISIVLIVIVIFLLRGAYNFSKMISTYKVRKKYEEWMFEKKHNVFNLEPRIKKLLLDAKIEDHSVPYTKPLAIMGGNLFYSKGRYSVFSNISANNKKINTIVVQKLLQAYGIYRYRAIESINPIFWIETIILLPKKVLNYLNVKSNLVKDIIQILYWIIGGIATLKQIGIKIPFL